jgi:hypothetical protein
MPGPFIGGGLRFVGDAAAAEMKAGMVVPVDKARMDRRAGGINRLGSSSYMVKT